MKLEQEIEVVIMTAKALGQFKHPQTSKEITEKILALSEFQEMREKASQLDHLLAGLVVEENCRGINAGHLSATSNAVIIHPDSCACSGTGTTTRPATAEEVRRMIDRMFSLLMGGFVFRPGAILKKEGNKQ